jgi:hypothetical protein
MTKLIVSMTTIPGRIGRIKRTIDSIQNQSHKPDVICLNLPKRCRRQKSAEYIIPDFIESSSNINIIRTDFDYGPSMKLLPVLEDENDPESIIITVDDDHEYKKDFIKNILKYSKQYPDCAIGFDGWNVNPLIEKNSWKWIDENLPEPVQVDVLAGFRGVLYKRKFFSQDIFEYDKFPKIAYSVDDVWISAHLAKHNIKRLLLPGVYSEEYKLSRGLHNKLSFKRVNRRMAIYFHKLGYW